MAKAAAADPRIAKKYADLGPGAEAVSLAAALFAASACMATLKIVRSFPKSQSFIGRERIPA